MIFKRTGRTGALALPFQEEGHLNLFVLHLGFLKNLVTLVLIQLFLGEMVFGTLFLFLTFKNQVLINFIFSL